MSHNVKELMMHCPKCQQTYNDNTLKFCLQDGEPLKNDQDAPTLVIQTEQDDEEFRAAMEIEAKYEAVLDSVIQALGKPIMTMTHIISIAPRCMSEYQVESAVTCLVEVGLLHRQKLDDGTEVYYHPKRIGRDKT
jgi:hypothetical protein